jgi:hypothetical protein
MGGRETTGRVQSDSGAMKQLKNKRAKEVSEKAL